MKYQTIDPSHSSHPFSNYGENIRKTSKKIMVGHIPYTQMGSQSGNSAWLATLTNKLLIRRAKREGRSVYTLQIDMNKAYNRVKRNQLGVKLSKLGVKEKLLRAIMSTYKTALEKIEIGGKRSETFSLSKGLRQGSILSPLLYLVDTIDLLNELQEMTRGLTAGDQQIPTVPVIMFVDDLSTLTDDIKQMITQLKIINNHTWKNGAIINIQKSKIASTQEENLLEETIRKTGITLGTTGTYVHLGTKYNLTSNPGQNTLSTGVTHRIDKARSILNTMLLRSRESVCICPKKVTEIVMKTIMSSLTFGRTHLELAGADKHAMKRLMGDTVRMIYCFDREKTLPDEWLLLEAHIPNPTDLIIMSDVKSIYDAKQPTTNKLVAAVINNDKVYRNMTVINCLKWGVSLENTLQLPKRDKGQYW
jgi:hypothetical protein